MKAIWNDQVLAESAQTIEIEGNHYFPPHAVRKEHFEESGKKTHCPWKGEACYYHVTVNGHVNQDAAWYYPNPKDAACEIKGHVAFWKGVKVVG